MTLLDERWLPSSLRSDYVPDIESDKRGTLGFAGTVVRDGFPERFQAAVLSFARAHEASVEEIVEATGLPTETIERLTVGWERFLPLYPPHIEERIRAKKAEDQRRSSAEGEVLAEAAG